jgi:5'-nucleotidase
MNRRSFIKSSLMASAGVALGSVTSWGRSFEEKRLTILHTNDTHSRLDPFPSGNDLAGKGGILARQALIESVRKEPQDVLLLDSGDIFQGTPYFNFFKGEPELIAMTKLGYQAATIGNHDFDGGSENLLTQWQKHASFPLLNANYDFGKNPLANIVQPYTVLKTSRSRLKIGIFGVGIELNGLVPDPLWAGITYRDPVAIANNISRKLLQEERCDFVICLSHLGYKYDSGKICDTKLAEQTSGIDLILGGHTHTFMKAPDKIKNKSGHYTLVNQAGWGGLAIGRLDFSFLPFQEVSLRNGETLDIKS